MKERPILFSAPMVRAVLGGRKTQTRRIVKPTIVQHIEFMGGSDKETTEFDFIGLRYEKWKAENGKEMPAEWLIYCTEYPEEGVVPIGQLYGAVGDRLWVRENWRIGAWNIDEGTVAIDYLADSYCRKEWLEADKDFADDTFERLWMQSTQDCIKAGLKMDDSDTYRWEPGKSPCRIRPSIHMPRWASRILLEITGVRVERLQDISEDDAEAEGIEGINQPTGGDDYQDYWRNYGVTEKQADGWPWFTGDRIASYKSLWESINGPASWDANPWVWVIEFKRIQTEARG